MSTPDLTVDEARAALIRVLELGERGGGGEWTWDDIVAYAAKAKGGVALGNENMRRRTAQVIAAAGVAHDATWPEVLDKVRMQTSELARLRPFETVLPVVLRVLHTPVLRALLDRVSGELALRGVQGAPDA